MPKPKPPTWADLTEHATDGEVEHRNYTARAGRSRMGKTTIVITCPFCRAEVEAYVWSLAGGGKRCWCGAMHGSLGRSHHWADEARR